jgi:hypothetical protein
MTMRSLKRRLEKVEEKLQQQLLAQKRPNPTDDPWVQGAIRDTYRWVTEFTKTWNEHWQEEGRPSPYEPFPPESEYPHIPLIFAQIDAERINLFAKSRDMMVSWGIVAYFTRHAMVVPHRGVLFQAQKESKAIQLIDYAKCLYDQQDERLKIAFPLSKPLRRQPKNTLEFAHGGKIVGIPGGADQIRSYHPWGYFNDESSFQPQAGECYNEALSVVKGKIVFNSSAGPGWYADFRNDIIRNQE